MSAPEMRTPGGNQASAGQATENACIIAATAGNISRRDQKTLRNRSTGTAAQLERMLAALRTGSKTTDDLRLIGIYQPGARIWQLRKAGCNIVTVLFDGFAVDGYSHARMGRYTLLSEPEGEQMALPLRRAKSAVTGRSGASAGVA